MNANVIALVPRQDGQPLTEQAGAVPDLDVWWWRVGQEDGNADPPKTSSRKESIPPFWTWFIENPRSCGA
jgi:hypothetical protein